MKRRGDGRMVKREGGGAAEWGNVGKKPSLRERGIVKLKGRGRGG